MARLLLLLLVAMAVVAAVALLVSWFNSAYQAGQHVLRTQFDTDGRRLMAPTGFQKVAYVALIVLMLGVSVGWWGGL